MIYQKYSKSQFRPRRPVRSFRDLEVYQEAQQCAVLAVKALTPLLEEKRIKGQGDKQKQFRQGQDSTKGNFGTAIYPFLDEMLNMSLDLPRIIADAHGARFDAKPSGLDYLNQAMKISNKIVVCLEQVRAIYNDIIDEILVEELIKRYIRNRVKIFRLYQAWKRFLEKDKDKKG